MDATRRGALGALAAGGVIVAAEAGAAGGGSGVQLIEVETRLVPGPVKVSVLRHPQAPAAGAPLLLLLHGGGGSNAFLGQMQATLETAWAAGELPPCVVATPDAKRSLYMDYRDGSQKWETFIVGELIARLRRDYGCSSARDKTVVSGISMGGLGALRLGFRRPDVFGGLAALEAGIEPALRLEDVKVRNSFQRGPRLLDELYGSPPDGAYWQANNPANIAIADRAAIAASGLQIYFEAGDLDMFHLDEGAEFLHRVLWDQGLRHEYRLVRGADHLGRTIPSRLRDGLKFLTRQVLDPSGPDNSYVAGKMLVETMKRAAGVDDREPRPPFPPLRP